MVDALNGRHLWADRFDRPAGDVFALQDEIVKRVFVELQVELTEGDHARVVSRGTDNLEAWLLRVQAYAELQKWKKDSMIRARELYEAAHILPKESIVPLIVGTAVSGVVGYLAIWFLIAYLRRHSTAVFIIYRLALGGGILILLWQGVLSP